MFVQVFTGWRYRPGVRDQLASNGLGGSVSASPRPDVPGLIARLLATETDDPDTGIGLWVWEDEASCRAYEANRSPEVVARLQAEMDDSAMVERTYDPLLFGVRRYER
jgi:hypothetical protein